MKCPIDGTLLAMTERYGVEIDYCPECRGVWLDRDELEKIIEHCSGQPVAAKAQTTPSHPAYAVTSKPSDPLQHYPKRRQRDPFLDDLFDF